MKSVRLHDRLWSSASTQKRRTAGGIIIPDSAKEKPSQGEITAVARAARRSGKLIPIDLKVGDRRPVREVVRTEVKLGWPGTADHEGSDIHGRPHRPAHRQEEAA